jgi:hypothetical protein
LREEEKMNKWLAGAGGTLLGLAQEPAQVDMSTLLMKLKGLSGHGPAELDGNSSA